MLRTMLLSGIGDVNLFFLDNEKNLYQKGELPVTILIRKYMVVLCTAEVEQHQYHLYDYSRGNMSSGDY